MINSISHLSCIMIGNEKSINILLNEDLVHQVKTSLCNLNDKTITKQVVSGKGQVHLTKQCFKIVIKCCVR